MVVLHIIILEESNVVSQITLRITLILSKLYIDIPHINISEDVDVDFSVTCGNVWIILNLYILVLHISNSDEIYIGLSDFKPSQSQFILLVW